MKKCYMIFAVLIILLFTATATGCPADEEPMVQSSFYVMFIDVGQADASLIMCDGRYMLIDGGNTEDSSRIYSVLKDKGVEVLDYVVSTHAHEDHIGGLPAAFNCCQVQTVFSPVTEYDTSTFAKFKNAARAQGKSLVMPKLGQKYSLGSAFFTVFAPLRKDYEEVNDSSIVLKLEYGDTSFLFTGDAERLSEYDMVEAGYDLSADVLKVGHHGSYTSTSYLFLREVMPTYGVISLGKGNEYGHPHDEILSRLSNADVQVLRTDELGDIICHSDGSTVRFEGIEPEVRGTPTAGRFVGNKKTGILHHNSCGGLPKENNRLYFCTITDAARAGYIKYCTNCMP